MKDGDFDIFDLIDDESLSHEIDKSIVNERHEKIKLGDKRRRLDELLEEKLLRSELDEYDEYLSQKRSYYCDDIFDD